MERSEIFNKVEKWITLGEHSRHTDYQIQHFIAGKEAINDFGGYKQMLREVDTRYTNMKNDLLDAKQVEIDLKRIDIKLDQKKSEQAVVASDTFESKLLECDIEELELEKQKQTNRLKQLESQLMKNLTELDRFYTLATYFEGKVKEKEAEGISIQDQETEYWEFKMKLHSYLSLCGATGSLMDSILALPAKSRNNVLEYLNTANQTRDRQGVLLAPDFLEHSMLNEQDILALHDGTNKKDFYALELTDGKKYVEDMVKALEDKHVDKE